MNTADVSRPTLVGGVAVVTGAAAGMGHAFTTALASEGMSVGMLDIDAKQLSNAANSMRADGLRVQELAVDVSDEAAVLAASRELQRDLGPIDVLVNNAAAHLSPYTSRPLQLPSASWDRLLRTNVVGIVNVTRAFEASLKQQRGVIVNIASTGSYTPDSAYGVSKLAVRGLTVALAKELGPRVRVCGISPGAIGTQSVRDELGEQQFDRYSQRQLVDRSGAVDDVVSALRFLISDGAGFITGETLIVGGGMAVQV